MTTVRQLNGETAAMTGEAIPPPDRQYPLTTVMMPMPRMMLTPVPTPGRTAKDIALVVLLVGIAFSGGFAADEYGHYKAWVEQHTRAVPEGDAVVGVPAELQLVVGEPTEVVGNTRGERIVWQSLSAELSLRKSGPKSVWVTGKKPGTYRMQAYSSVENLPTTPALVSVVVRGEDGKP